jgi:hypothetical protein
MAQQQKPSKQQHISSEQKNLPAAKYHSAAAAAAIDANIGAADLPAADLRVEAGLAAASRDLPVGADFSTVAESLPAAAGLLIAAVLKAGA